MRKYFVLFLFFFSSLVYSAEMVDRPDQWFGWTRDTFTGTDYTVFGTDDRTSLKIISATTVTAAATASIVLTLADSSDFAVVTIRSGTADLNIDYATSIAGIINCASFEFGLFNRIEEAKFYAENHVVLGGPPPLYLPNVSNLEEVQFYQINKTGVSSTFLKYFGSYLIPTEGMYYAVLRLTPKVITGVADGVTYINTNGITVSIKSGYY